MKREESNLNRKKAGKWHFKCDSYKVLKKTPQKFMK